MGIDTHYYTVYGIKHEWDDVPSEWREEAYEDAYGDDDTPNVIIDSMSGEYIIFGEILYDSGNLRWGEMEDVFVEIDLYKLPAIETAYKKAFVAKFPQFASLVEAPFKLMTFAHYS